MAYRLDLGNRQQPSDTAAQNLRSSMNAMAQFNTARATERGRSNRTDTSSASEGFAEAARCRKDGSSRTDKPW
jgi:hypothetical protein